MNLIVKMVFGSHFYGTNTPESDKDYKGVFMPTKEQIYLGKISKCYSEQSGDDKSKNTKEDTDTEIYSLHYFIELACQGQTVALDMLHAPDGMLLHWSPLWDSIVNNRHRFYTKSMKAFVGYARRQAAKYGIKGSRLDAAKKVLDFINDFDVPKNRSTWERYLEESNKIDYIRLSQVWDQLPEGEHIRKIPASTSPVTTLEGMKKFQAIRTYEVCGKKIQETASLMYMKDIIGRFYKSYGERARMAQANEGIDWKAVSHALRAAYQIKQILTEKTITFPLPQAEGLKMVKAGELDYTTNVAPLLENLMEQIEILAEKSDLPEKVDRKFWDEFMIDEVAKEMHADWLGYHQ